MPNLNPVNHNNLSLREQAAVSILAALVNESGSATDQYHVDLAVRLADRLVEALRANA